MHNFRNLDVWKKSLQLTKSIYLTTSDFPKHEQWGLTSQMRRSAVSISSNIAEGSSRKSNKDFIRFLEISLGSAFELETQVITSKEVEFITEDKLIEINNLITEIQKKIYRLIESLKDK
jgi:four helix bundle protein